VNHYYLLGRSGQRVSRLALGTMNFGTGGFHATYGKTEEEAEPIFRRYVESGGKTGRIDHPGPSGCRVVEVPG
jgi:aryl-alcohol dehydrogenase-like predicted oxidoreductase